MAQSELITDLGKVWQKSPRLRRSAYIGGFVIAMVMMGFLVMDVGSMQPKDGGLKHIPTHLPASATSAVSLGNNWYQFEVGGQTFWIYRQHGEMAITQIRKCE